MTTRLTVRGIIYNPQTDSVFVQKLKKLQDNSWYLPGGKVENKESLISALKREIFEECGIEAQVDRLVCINQFFDSKNDTNVVAFLFLITNYADFIDIDLAKTSHGVAEIAEFKFISRENESIIPKWMSSVDKNILTENNSKPCGVDFYDEF